MGPVFTIDCPRHGTSVLLSERRIRSMRPSPSGLEVEVECWCGHRSTLTTGRPLVGRHRPAV